MGPAGRLLRSERRPVTLGLATAASEERICVHLERRGGWQISHYGHGSALHPQGHASTRRLALAGGRARHGWDRRYLCAIVASEVLSRCTVSQRVTLARLRDGRDRLSRTRYSRYASVLEGATEAYGVLDSVRAVLEDVPGLAGEVEIVGRSQGGGAASRLRHKPLITHRSWTFVGSLQPAGSTKPRRQSRAPDPATCRRWTARSLTFCTSPGWLNRVLSRRWLDLGWRSLRGSQP